MSTKSFEKERRTYDKKHEPCERRERTEPKCWATTETSHPPTLHLRGFYRGYVTLSFEKYFDWKITMDYNFVEFSPLLTSGNL